MRRAPAVRRRYRRLGSIAERFLRCQGPEFERFAFGWITAGSHPGHVEFQKFFRQAHDANGPTAKRLSSSPPSTNVGRVFRAALRGTPSDGEVPQQRGSVAQLTSDSPCNAKELAIARGLNAPLQESSSEAKLVVTDLPDMLLGESVLGCCQLVDAMSWASSVSPCAWYRHGGHTWT